MRIRRLLPLAILVAIAVALLFILRARKRQFIAAQIELLQSADSQQATEARKRLQRIGRSAVRPVCTLLRHDDEEVRARAALTLANIGHPAACGPLMEAARRGDFPAADALEFVKHPRAAEARAWAYCRLGDRALEELKLRLPVGGRLPTAPYVHWERPRAPFGHSQHTLLYWPRIPVGLDYPWSDLLIVRDMRRWYWQALRTASTIDACSGSASLYELGGYYEVAGELWARVLKLDPDSETARNGKARTDRLAAIQAEMAALVPSSYVVGQVFEDSTWRDGAATYSVGVVSLVEFGSGLGAGDPKLVLSRSTAGGLQKVATVPTYRPADLADVLYTPNTYANSCVPEVNRPAAVAAVRSLQMRLDPRSRRLMVPYEVALYRPEGDALVKLVQLSSDGIPWVGDIDEDGDAEIVTWRDVRPDVWPGGAPLPWPAVYTSVDGQYQERTREFPALFAPIEESLAAGERKYGLDPGALACLANAYEILGKRDMAVATYQGADERISESAVGRAFSNQQEADRVIGRARQVLKQRRLHLETAHADESAP